MKRAREVADEKARLFVETMANALNEALDGETLRGLPDLGDRVFGLRIGLQGSAFARLPKNRRVLIIDARGQLRAATLFPEGAHVEDPEPQEFVASMLDGYIHAMRTALEAHERSCATRTESFMRIATVADRLSKAIL